MSTIQLTKYVFQICNVNTYVMECMCNVKKKNACVKDITHARSAVWIYKVLLFHLWIEQAMLKSHITLKKDELGVHMVPAQKSAEHKALKMFLPLIWNVGWWI